MAFQLSPGVLIREQDLTNVVPAVATTIGGIVGDFNWGPSHQIVNIDSENNLVAVFGKPTSANHVDFMTTSSFLSYGSNSLVCREVGPSALNAVSSGTPVLIKNREVYDESYGNGEGSVGPWAAKYAGTLGNSLKVSMADLCSFTNTSVQDVTVTNGGTGYTLAPTVTFADPDTGSVVATGTATLAGDAVASVTVNFPGYGYTSAPTVTFTNADGDSTGAGAAATSSLTTAWEYAGQFDSVPGTTSWAENAGSTIDELHIIVIDEDGAFTGIAGTVLEKFAGVSKASDSKDDVNQSNYYKDVINNRSKYLWSMDHHANGINWGYPATGISAYNAILAGASDTTVSLTGGANDAPELAQLQSGYDLFANDELVDVSLIMTSGHTPALAKYVIDNVSDVRKDCITFISPQRASVVNNEGSEESAVKADLEEFTRSSYAVLDSGWKYMYDKYNDRYVYVPLNGDIAGTCVVADLNNDPWFSPAGYNRGVIKNAVKLAWSPKKAERDELYKSGINPVVGFPGNGIVLFGDKTLLAKPSAFNRINVRRLFIVLEKAIATAAKYQLFEFNDAFTRAQFRSLVEPFLRDVQGRRGIYDFRVVCDETNNTAEVVDSNEFRADIFVKPAKSINFITLTFVATRTGISFEELGA